MPKADKAAKAKPSDKKPAAAAAAAGGAKAAAAAPAKKGGAKAPAKPVAAAAKGGKAGDKKGAVADKKGPKGGIAKQPKKEKVSLFQKKTRNYTIGNSLPPRRDLSRLVRWPRYIRLQRQKAILYERMKIPPAINQFNNTADLNTANNLFRLLTKYRPEDRTQKRARLLEAAKSKDHNAASKKPVVVKFGINHITALIEAKKAKLVVIAHDVDPIELVVWLPALCRKLDIPYMIVKSKARLGQIVHKKTATALALCDVRKEDASALATLVSAARDNFNNNVTARRNWGEGRLGVKSRSAKAKLEKAVAREQRRKVKGAKKDATVAAAPVAADK
jgi:large subunit ribosomal protein L7Ae